MLLLLLLVSYSFCQIDYNQIFSLGNGFPLLGPDPRQSDTTTFYQNQEQSIKAAARGIPLNFNSVIHNVKNAPVAAHLELWDHAFHSSTSTTTSLPIPHDSSFPVRRQRAWPKEFSYDAYEGGRMAGWYDDDRYDGYGGPPPRRPSRPRPRRPPSRYHNRYGRPDDWDSYGRSPPRIDNGGEGGGISGGNGEGTKGDTVKIGSSGKGTITSDAGGLLSGLNNLSEGMKSEKGEAKKDDEKKKKDDKKKDENEGTKADVKKENDAEDVISDGLPLDQVKESGQTRAPGHGKNSYKSKNLKKKKSGKKKSKRHSDEEEEDNENEDDENGPLEEVDGEVKVPKTVDGETNENERKEEEDEEEEEKKVKKRLKKKGKKRRGKHEKEEDDDDGEEEEQDDEEEEDNKENEDEEQDDCLTETTTMRTTTESHNDHNADEDTECEEDKKERSKSKEKHKKNKKKSAKKKKESNCAMKKKPSCKKTRSGQRSKWDKVHEGHSGRHSRSDPDTGENVISASNSSEPITMPGLNCGEEKDEFPTKCGAWKGAGYCESNQATQYLWCRKTCLCPPGEKRTKRDLPWFLSIFR